MQERKRPIPGGTEISKSLWYFFYVVFVRYTRPQSPPPLLLVVITYLLHGHALPCPLRKVPFTQQIHRRQPLTSRIAPRRAATSSRTRGWARMYVLKHVRSMQRKLSSSSSSSLVTSSFNSFFSLFFFRAPSSLTYPM